MLFKIMYFIFTFTTGLGNSARTTKSTLIMGMFQVTLLASDNSANTSTVSFNSNMVQDVSVPTPSEIVAYPTAASKITYIRHDQNELRSRAYLTALTPAALSALINASNLSAGSGVSGDATLVAGTINVTIPGLTTASKAVLTRHTVAGTVTATVEYQYVVSANTLAITAAVAAGTINTADTSVITYAIVG